MPTLAYHQHTHDLLTRQRSPEGWRVPLYHSDGVTPLDLYRRPATFATNHLRLLDTFEAWLGWRLPAAFREWYALDYSHDLTPLLDAMSYSTTLAGFLSSGFYHTYAGWLAARQIPLVNRPGRVWSLDASDPTNDDPPVISTHPMLPLGSQSDLVTTQHVTVHARRFSDLIHCRVDNWLAHQRFPLYVSIARRSPSYATVGTVPLGPHVHPLPAEASPTLAEVEARFRRLPCNYKLQFAWERGRLYPKLEFGDSYGGNPNAHIKSGYFQVDALDSLHDGILQLWEPENIPFLNLLVLAEGETLEMLRWMEAKYGDGTRVQLPLPVNTPGATVSPPTRRPRPPMPPRFTREQPSHPLPDPDSIPPQPGPAATPPPPQ